MALPLLIAGAAAPFVGGLVKGAAGVGKNNTRAPAFHETSAYDPDAAFYGGYRGARQQYNANLNYRRMEAEGRATPQANYGQASNWDSQAAQSRTSQGNAANLMMQRATGAVPSIAGQQAELDARRAYSQQMATAASARGAAGVALAGQTAANNISNQGAAMSNQAQINVANERMQAERAAFDAYGNIRQGDALAAQEQARRAEFAVGSEFQNRGINDTRAMGYEGLEARANEAELMGRVQNQGTLAGSTNVQTTANANRVQRNADWANNNWDRMTQGPQQGGGGPVPGRASGGPVAGGRPYVVGEAGREALVSGGRARLIGQDGPELIVPSRDGYVIPNHALSASAKLVKQVSALGKGGRGAPKKAAAKPSGPTFDQLLAKRPDRIAPAQVRERPDLREYLAAQQAAQDEQAIRDEEARIYAEQDSRIAKLREEDARRARDPAVGLERIERDRSQLNRGGPRYAAPDEAGQAPGQSDWDRYGVPEPAGELRKDSKGQEYVHRETSEEPLRYTPGKGMSGGGRKDPSGTVGPLTDEQKVDQYASIARRFFGGARAAGGPVAGGLPYLVGEKGPELLLGGGAGAGPASASFDVLGPGGNMDVQASDAAHKSFGARFGMNAGASPVGYREDGGPVEAGKPYVVGEAGEEAFVPAPHPNPLPTPPKPPPIAPPETSPDQFESPNEQAVYDYARTLQGQGLGRNSYDVAAMLRNAPEGPAYAEKMKEAKEGPKSAHQIPPIDWKKLMNTATVAALAKGGKSAEPEPKTEKKSTGVNRPAPKRKR